MDQPIKKVRGIGAKVRSYLSSMHPEFNNRTSARELVSKYPQYEELVSAITAHDPGIKERSLGSIRGNLRSAYEFMKLVENNQQSTGVKRKRDEAATAGGPVEKKQATEEGKQVVPNVVPNALDALVSDGMKTKPFGESNFPLKDGSNNVSEPLPTWAQQQKNYPLADALSESKAIDLAEADPIKPHKELEFVPDAMESALLTVQEENYLETRNAGRLLHTTVLPAAALVPNDGGGAREGVRRSDNDMEVEESKQQSAIQDEEMGQGGGSGGAGKAPTAQPFQAPQKGEYEQTLSQMVATGQLHGPIGSAIGGLGMMAKGAIYGTAALAGMNPGASAAAVGAAGVLDSGTKVAKEIANRGLDVVNIRARMAKEGVDPNNWQQYVEKMQVTEGKTQLEQKGSTIIVDELRPFFPIAGSMDVELQPGDVEQKKRNAALFANYKPPNWPLGNMDNQLYFQNLVLMGVQWMSPLDSIPPVLPGGSLYTGVLDFGSYTNLPADDMLVDLGVKQQIEFRLNGGAQMVHRLRCLHAGEIRNSFMLSDTKYIHNPMAEGVNSAMEDLRSDMNPLSTPLHADLQVGGSRELRPLMPECDAFSTMEQPGGGRGNVVNTNYTKGAMYNYFGIYPGVY